MLRIIAGEYRSRKIKTLPTESITRPTSDRVRESLFNIIQSEVIDSRMVDLFSGTGALGIEALSRGAAHVVFVESNRLAMQIIQENLALLVVDPKKYTLVSAPVSSFLSNPSTFGVEKGSVTLMLADPPYKSDWYEQALTEISQSGLCSKNCTLGFEMDAYTQIDEKKHLEWKKKSRRKYGKTYVEFWIAE